MPFLAKFLHPGLSTKKVLVTEKGQCKLYDFFLSEDAPNKTRNIKSEVCDGKDMLIWILHVCIQICLNVFAFVDIKAEWMNSYFSWFQKDCSINDLSPEALLRNEYSQASDMWCVAVVLWKLMTYGMWHITYCSLLNIVL